MNMTQALAGHRAHSPVWGSAGAPPHSPVFSGPSHHPLTSLWGLLSRPGVGVGGSLHASCVQLWGLNLEEDLLNVKGQEYTAFFLLSSAGVT